MGHIRDYFRKLEEANNTQRSEYARQFAWTPPGLQQGVVGIQDLSYYINYFLPKPQGPHSHILMTGEGGGGSEGFFGV